MDTDNKKEVVMMSTTAQKWGNSIGVRIPQQIAKKYGVVSGSKINVIEDHDGIKLRPADRSPTLEELLSKCTPENRHEEIDYGQAGKELF